MRPKEKSREENTAICRGGQEDFSPRTRGRVTVVTVRFVRGGEGHWWKRR